MTIWMRGSVSGKGCIFAWQGMDARHATHNTQFKDFQNVTHHEKCNTDGATHVKRSNIKNSFGHKYGEGMRNLVSHLAEYIPALINVKRMGSAIIYLIDRYIYLLVPEYGIDKAATASASGYSGISKDGYYLRKGNTMDI